MASQQRCDPQHTSNSDTGCPYFAAQGPLPTEAAPRQVRMAAGVTTALALVGAAAASHVLGSQRPVLTASGKLCSMPRHTP